MKKYLIISITSLIVLLIGLSYSYFQVNLVNKDLDALTVDSKELKIIFNDSREIIAEGIKPGTFNETKSFSVENKSEDTYYYNIVFKDLINTFVTDS